jgi:hypothetical protein
MFYFIPRLFQKNWIHILVWSAMLIYVAAAPPFYARYILKDGRPVLFDEKLPQVTEQISYGVDRFDPVVLHGQNLYNLWGWSFMRGEPDQAAYERLIVLQSDSRTYFFSSANNARPDVQALFADLHLDLINTGFSAYISKDMVELGTYQIGILVKDRANDTIYYVVTNKSIIRTPNKLQLLIP